MTPTTRAPDHPPLPSPGSRRLTRRALLQGAAGLSDPGGGSRPAPSNAGFHVAPAPVRRLLEAMVEEDGAPGVHLRCWRDGRPRYDARIGRMDPSDPVGVWLTAAVMMTVVDEGIEDADAFLVASGWRPEAL